MTVFRDTVSEQDVARLAALHVNILPRSLVSRLGLRYTRTFYGYVARSPREVLCVARDRDGLVRAGLVLSFDPASLQRRLLLATPLAPAIAVRPWVVALRSMLRDLLLAGTGEDLLGERPELIIIFVDRVFQGRGLGRELVAQLEAALAERKIGSYFVKTEDQPGNRALDFYTRTGFRRLGCVERHGIPFALLDKQLETNSCRASFDGQPER
jgi:ribosomal protein S18 acetylase RimI-like enzyme